MSCRSLARYLVYCALQCFLPPLDLGLLTTPPSSGERPAASTWPPPFSSLVSKVAKLTRSSSLFANVRNGREVGVLVVIHVHVSCFRQVRVIL